MKIEKNKNLIIVYLNNHQILSCLPDNLYVHAHPTDPKGVVLNRRPSNLYYADGVVLYVDDVVLITKGIEKVFVGTRNELIQTLINDFFVFSASHEQNFAYGVQRNAQNKIVRATKTNPQGLSQTMTIAYDDNGFFLNSTHWE